MTETRRAHLVLLARLLSVFTVLSVLHRPVAVDHGPGRRRDLGLLLAFGLFPIVGYFMATRRPENALSWLMVGLGVAIGVGALLSSYAGYALNGGIGGRQLGLIAEAFDNPMWIPVVVPPVTFMLLLFPDGHLPSPRWQVVRTHPRREHGDRLPDDPPGAGEVRRRGRVVRGLPEPARRGGAPPGALGRRSLSLAHAPDRGHRFALGLVGRFRRSTGTERSSCGCWWRRPRSWRSCTRSPCYLVRGLMGRQPADVDDDPAERLRLLVRLDPDRDRRYRCCATTSSISTS